MLQLVKSHLNSFGEQIYQDKKIKKYYSETRQILTRNVLRNMIRKELKNMGYTKINKHLSRAWEHYQDKKHDNLKQNRVNRKNRRKKQ